MSQELSDEDFPMVCDDVTRKILPGMEVIYNPEMPNAEYFAGAAGFVESAVPRELTTQPMVRVKWSDMAYEPSFLHPESYLLPKHDSHQSMMAFVRAGLQASQQC